VLNSVIQYFPSVDYLLSVLDEASERLETGGRIFIGDVRCFRLREMFHTSLELYRASDTSPVSEIRRRIAERMAREEELLLDPRFFFALKARYPNLTQVTNELKRGRSRNELTRFRFDVALHFGGTTAQSPDIPWREWSPQNLSLSTLREMLDSERSDAIRLRRVPNARLTGDVVAIRELGAAAGRLSARQLKEKIKTAKVADVDPEDLWVLGAERGYDVAVTASEEPSCFDAMFRRRGSEAARFEPASFGPFAGSLRPLRTYASDPISGRRRQRLAHDLRALTASKLPDYMIPSAFVMLRQFPLTANGKVDRDALPAPAGRPDDATLVAPRTPEEAVLAGIWSDILRLDKVGMNDDFFALGGHSLLATQVISRVREAFAIELQVRAMFEAPTIA